MSRELIKINLSLNNQFKINKEIGGIMLEKLYKDLYIDFNLHSQIDLI